jgi:hypothetical protein
MPKPATSLLKQSALYTLEVPMAVTRVREYLPPLRPTLSTKHVCQTLIMFR